MIRDQGRLCDFVIHSGAEVQARHIVHGGWRLPEKLQPASKQDAARESTKTGKARKMCAHNFHSYKNDNTPNDVALAIQIFPYIEDFSAQEDRWHLKRSAFAIGCRDYAIVQGESQSSPSAQMDLRGLTRACSPHAAHREIGSWHKGSTFPRREIFVHLHRRTAECRRFCPADPRDMQPS